MAEFRTKPPRLRVVSSEPARKPALRRSGPDPRPLSAGVDSLIAFSVIFFAILIPHLPLLALPYFWDEAGYYIPAARDLLLSGSLIPHTTLSNAHPPLVMAWLALWWKLAGFAPVVTRCAMLMITAAALSGVYRLAYGIANRQVAVAATACTALFPPFFAQSTLAHLDMAAAALTIWGLVLYLERRTAGAVTALALAALAKETAVLAPVALFGWELACHHLEKRTHRRLCALPRSSWRESAPLLLPIVPLALWFAFHWARAGYVFGNPAFFGYNVAHTFSPIRIFLALLQRIWQVTGYLNMYLLTLAAAAAMFVPFAVPVQSPGTTRGGVVNFSDRLRERIAIPAQLVLLVMIATYVVAMSVLGGAVLARYLMPVFPLWIVLCVATLQRRSRMWRAMTGVICAGFVLALLFPPMYRIAPEDTLAYRDFVELHEAAITELQAQPQGVVLTAWPATDELQRPWLGYVGRPLETLAIEDFSEAELGRAGAQTGWTKALIFSTKYDPPGGSVLDGLGWWRRAHQRWFGYHGDAKPDRAAELLHSHIVWSQARHGEWAAILVRDTFSRTH